MLLNEENEYEDCEQNTSMFVEINRKMMMKEKKMIIEIYVMQ